MNTRIKEISSLPRDFGAGLRMIRCNPRFAMLVIGTIALGIGVNTAMLSVVDLFRFNARRRYACSSRHASRSL